MAEITIGSEAKVRATGIGGTYTIINFNGAATGTGTIDTIEIYARSNLAGVKAGTFFGAGGTFTNRDWEAIGAVVTGSKQTFSGLDCDVESGDWIGFYSTGGEIERDYSGDIGIYRLSGDQFGTGEQSGYYFFSGDLISLYGTGEEEAPVVLPTVITEAVDNIDITTATGHGDIDADGGEACDHRGIVYGKTSHGDPGDTAPGDTAYDDFEDEADGFGEVPFSRSLTGLDKRTKYYVRAYAHNSAGYAYGDEVSFTTKIVGPFPTHFRQ